MYSSTLKTYLALILGLMVVCFGCTSTLDTDVPPQDEPECDLFLFEIQEELNMLRGVNENIVFGTYTRSCGVPDRCWETYLLTEERLFEDQIDSEKRDSFDYHCLPDSLFIQVAHIRDIIPAELLEPDAPSFYGCPDCVDQGGIYLQLVAEEKEFFIDRDLRQLPSYLIDFAIAIVDLVRNVLP